MVSKTFKRPRVRLAVGFEVRALAGAGSKPAAAGPKVNVVSSKASIQALAQLTISALLQSPDEAAATSRRLSCRCFALRMLEGMPICVLTSYQAIWRSPACLESLIWFAWPTAWSTVRPSPLVNLTSVICLNHGNHIASCKPYLKPRSCKALYV